MFDCRHVCACVRACMCCICMCIGSFVSDSFDWMVRVCIHFAKWFEVWCSLFCCRRFNYMYWNRRQNEKGAEWVREKSKRNERNNQKKTILLKSQKMRRKKITQHILCAMYCLSGTQNNMHCIALFSLFVSFRFVLFQAFHFHFQLQFRWFSMMPATTATATGTYVRLLCENKALCSQRQIQSSNRAKICTIREMCITCDSCVCIRMEKRERERAKEEVAER